MNIIGKTLALMALVPVALTIAGCGNNAEPVEKTAAGATISDDSLTAILDSNDALSGFNEIADNSELEGLLAGGTPYTIFAPNNAALGKLPKDDLSASRIAGIVGMPTPFHVYRALNSVLSQLRLALEARGIEGSDG